MGTNPEPAWQPLAIEAGAPLPKRPTDAGAQAARWAARCEASDAATPAVRLTALYAAVSDTILILERAQLLPADHEHGPNAWEAYLCTVGNQRFAAAMTGSLDTPARHYIVTTTSDDEEGPGVERFTMDLNQVRAWLLSWAVALEEQCTHEESYLGACVACGAVREHEDGHSIPLPVGCMGRGWYHDGSEDAEAMAQHRPRRSCPSCTRGGAL